MIRYKILCVDDEEMMVDALKLELVNNDTLRHNY